ncbi:DUF946 domain-containing protein [candidate division GN15 bacterium]|nr:DUF946 domain-containing protein [candidate division GN15 bacterium]
MISCHRIAYLVPILCLLLLTNCGNESPIEPISDDSLATSGLILVDKLAVSVVPGGSETVIVHEIEGSDDATSFEVEPGDPSVASIIVAGSDIVVSGLVEGETELVISAASGIERRIPIHVYNHQEVDFGEIRLKFWTDYGNPRGYMGTLKFFHPEFPGAWEGWYALGSFIDDEAEGHDRVVLVVKVDSDADPDDPPLAYPESYVYDTYCDMGDYESRAAFYRAIAPEGYQSLGTVAMFRDGNQPSPGEMVCIRDDLVHFGEPASDARIISVAHGSCPGIHTRELVDIVPVATAPHERAYFAAGTYTLYEECHGENSVASDYNVLCLDVPVIASSAEQTVIPRLTGLHAPPDQSLPTQLKAVLLPYNTVSDEEYADREGWRQVNSPFYRLERETYYKLRYYNYNQTSVMQENQLEIVSGTVASQSELFWEESGISITKETGVMIGVKGYAQATGKYTANVSRKLGYATMTNVEALREEHTTTTIFTPPGKAAAMWQKYDRFTLYRHNGTELQQVSTYEFGVNDFITDEYPDSE